MILAPDLAIETRMRVEAQAESVGTWEEWATPGRADGKPYTTICNGYVKPEGEACVGMVASEDEFQALAERFIAACLAIKEGSRLIWRRYPQFEKATDDGPQRFKLTARLAWLN